MPFVRMENISHFLRVCQTPPFNLPAHDIFLTVDLYESKDPAQVLQCIEAFSRKASVLCPDKIPSAIGGRKGIGMSSGYSSPQSTASLSPPQVRGTNINSVGNTSAYGRTSPTKGVIPGAPAWNYAQYGWMGGASQGNQGVTFGSRRQITAPTPNVPSLAEKERKRRDVEAESEKRRQEMEGAERKQKAEQEAEDEEKRAREEEQHAAEEARRREEDRMQVEAEKRQWEVEQKNWRKEEDQRIKEENIAEARLEKDRQRRRANSDARLQGQLLSQYQAEQEQISEEKARISELEKQLAEAKARERQYEDERRGITQHSEHTTLPAQNPIQPLPDDGKADMDEQVWNNAERDYLRSQWKETQPLTSSRPLPTPQASKSPTARLPPTPTTKTEQITPARPLPIPSSSSSSTSNMNTLQTPNRTDRYLATNPTPAILDPVTHTPPEAPHDSTAESDAEAQRRIASQNATKAGGWASKSLLEREMERERTRQKEWEDAQKETQDAASKGLKDPNAGSGPGQSWDVHSYGYNGGDNMNRGTSGVFAGRRQILGPRPLEKK